MEGITQLSTWLRSGQDYAQGLALARTHGVTGKQLRLLESGNNKFTQGRLREALQAVLDQLSSDASRPAPSRATVASTTSATSSTPTAATSAETPAAAPVQVPVPAELVQLRARRVQTWKLAVDHFGQMKQAPEGPLRKEHAKAIKRLMRENARLWADEEYYHKFGFLPPVAPVATLDLSDPAEVLRRRNTLRTYVSSKRGTPDKLAAWSAELLELNLVLEHGQPV